MPTATPVRHAVQCVRCGDRVPRADAVLVAPWYYVCTRCEAPQEPPQEVVHDPRD